MASNFGFGLPDDPQDPPQTGSQPPRHAFVLPQQFRTGSNARFAFPVSSQEKPYQTSHQYQTASAFTAAPSANDQGTSFGSASNFRSSTTFSQASSSQTAPMFDFTLPNGPNPPSFTGTPGFNSPMPDNPSGPDFPSFEFDPLFEGWQNPPKNTFQSPAASEPSTALTHEPRQSKYTYWSPQSTSQPAKTVSQWDLAVNSVKPIEVDEESTPWIGGFNYSLMIGDPEAFRLLVLEPSTSRESKLEGWLFVSSLESHPVYETLSYVWGNLSTHEVIKLRELKVQKTIQSRKRWTGPAVDFKITHNLAVALRQLRHPLVARVMWVDCICINQQDNDERSSQVQQMARIYKQGARSMIWLGADDDKRHGAVLQLLKELSNMPLSHLDEINLQKKIWNEWNAQYSEIKDTVVRSADAKIKSPFPSKVPTKMSDTPLTPAGGLNDQSKPKIYFADEKAVQRWIKDFFDNRPLWKRIWIMQEIVFAPHPFLLCGARSLEWEALSHCMDQRSSNLSFLLRESQSWKHACMINQRRKQLISHRLLQAPKSDLLSLFLRCQTFRSTDPRDMLYALLNLTTENPGIKPNYNITSQEMWVAFGKALMAHTKSLLLLYQDESILTVSERDLPSWISYSLNPMDFWFNESCSSDAADFSLGYIPQDYETNHTMLRYLPVMSVLIDTLQNDQTPDYPFYRLYPSEAHHRYWNSTEVNQDYLSAKDLMQDCLKEFLPAHLGRIQTTSSGSKGHDTLAISGHRRLSKEEIGLYEQQWRHQKWDQLALSETMNGADAIPDRLRRLRFDITPKGFPVLLPPSARKGDQLFVLFGCAVPIVLRSLGRFNQSKTYKVVGQAFVHGADRGQAVHPDYIRSEQHLWSGPLIPGTDDLPWEERKAAIHKARVDQWKDLQVDAPKLIFLD